MALAACTVSNAKSKKATVAKGASYIKMQEAYTQTTMPGRPEGQPTTETHFVLVWNDNTPPETFYWRAAPGTWMSCRVAKATKLAHENEAGIEYTTEDVKLSTIKKGYLLDIMPLQGGKQTVPAGIDRNTTNTLFFKTKKTNWLTFPVKEIKRKRDIAMP